MTEKRGFTGLHFIRKIDGAGVRVMAEAENYLMVRRKGYLPFIIPKRDLLASFQPVDEASNG